MKINRVPKVLLLAVILISVPFAVSAREPIRIGVISSVTGPIAFVGISHKNSMALLPTKLGNDSLEYIFFDDGSDPTQTVRLATKLLNEQKIDVLLGPSGSPNAIAAIPFLAEAKTPMLAVVGTQAAVLPMDEQKRWIFKTTQNDSLMASTLVAHMVKTGVKTIGFIGYNDSYGESWYKTIEPLLKKENIRIIANERYSRNDSSITGQATKLFAAKPDAVFVAAVGAGAALPNSQLLSTGYKGKIYQTHGAASPDFIKVGGKAVEGVIMAASPMLVLSEIPDSNISKKIATDYVNAYQKAYGATPPTFGAAFYDGGLLLKNAIPQALKRGEPGTQEFRTALRDALENTKELVVTQGVYNMSPQDHSGFDERGSVLVTVKDGRFVLLR